MKCDCGEGEYWSMETASMEPDGEQIVGEIECLICGRCYEYTAPVRRGKSMSERVSIATVSRRGSGRN